MERITVTRDVTIPDKLRLQRYRRFPELGPKILFFTGGSALKQFSHELIRYTHNSIHLMTPFDSGGSSAKLRDAFDMPAVGDLRNRLMAMSDDTITGNPEVYDLAAYRLPEDLTHEELKTTLLSIASGEHDLIRRVPEPLNEFIRLQLKNFINEMPDSFDLKGASIGNLIITGGYLYYHRKLDPILTLFSKALAINGIVKPIVDIPLHLVAELDNGESIIGQHHLTGKETTKIDSPVKNLFLSSCLDSKTPVETTIDENSAKFIETAELICYPPGSFYSSVIANLLPKGVAKEIASNRCPKIYIPNQGNDPEQLGMSLQDSIETLLSYLRKNSDDELPTEQLLNFILVDSRNGDYPGGIPYELLSELGIQIIDTELITERFKPLYDNTKLVNALLSIV